MGNERDSPTWIRQRVWGRNFFYMVYWIKPESRKNLARRLPQLAEQTAQRLCLRPGFDSQPGSHWTVLFPVISQSVLSMEAKNESKTNINAINIDMQLIKSLKNIFFYIYIYISFLCSLFVINPKLMETMDGVHLINKVQSKSFCLRV